MRRFKRLMGVPAILAIGLGVTISMFGFTPAHASHDTCNNEPDDRAVVVGGEVIVGVDPGNTGLPTGTGADVVAVCHPGGVVAVTQMTSPTGLGTSFEVWTCGEGTGWTCSPVLNRTGAFVYASPRACLWVDGQPVCEP